MLKGRQRLSEGFLFGIMWLSGPLPAHFVISFWFFYSFGCPCAKIAKRRLISKVDHSTAEEISVSGMLQSVLCRPTSVEAPCGVKRLHKPKPRSRDKDVLIDINYHVVANRPSANSASPQSFYQQHAITMDLLMFCKKTGWSAFGLDAETWRVTAHAAVKGQPT